MLEFVFLTLLGVLSGVFTGLTPGIHPNTVIFGSLPIYFSSELRFFHYLSFVSGLSVAHTFHDFIPTIFLNAPDAESALSSIPGVSMALEGRGIEAFHYTLSGGIYSVLVFLFALPFLLLGLETVYCVLSGYMNYLLLFLLLVLIFESESLGNALLITSLSGALGLLAFRMPVNQQFVLVPVFSGLFALPAVFMVLKSGSEIPRQRKPLVGIESSIRGGITGFLAGIMAGIFPGLGAAASTSFLTPIMEESEEEFLAAMGGVNTSDILISFVALYTLGKARSGASVALKAIAPFKTPQIVFLIGSCFIAVSVSLLIAFRVPRYFIGFVEKFSVRRTLYLVLAVLIGSSFYLTGFPGMLVLLTSSFIGYLGMESEERRLCMSVLIVPAILFFSDISIFM